MYSLRKANKDDINLLIKYKLSTIIEYAKELTDDESTRIKDYVNDSVSRLLNDYKMVVYDKKDIGCLLVTTCEDGKLLDEIYLEEDYRGRGLGTKLIRDVLSKHSVVYLWVYKENKDAIRLYKRLGFKIFEETDSRYKMKYIKE